MWQTLSGGPFGILGPAVGGQGSPSPLPGGAPWSSVPTGRAAAPRPWARCQPRPCAQAKLGSPGQEGPAPTSKERCVVEHPPGSWEPGHEPSQWQMSESPHLAEASGTRTKPAPTAREKTTKTSTVRPHGQCGQYHGVMRTVPSPSAGITSSPVQGTREGTSQAHPQAFRRETEPVGEWERHQPSQQVGVRLAVRLTFNLLTDRFRGPTGTFKLHVGH